MKTESHINWRHEIDALYGLPDSLCSFMPSASTRDHFRMWLLGYIDPATARHDAAHILAVLQHDPVLIHTRSWSELRDYQL